ncbi:MAG: PIN domain protein [Ignavibacteria bacterium GWB2_35_12]|nr:MAG: PIN domain protein [Ignavibacteria bacterium GWB2_35_12]OGU93240.1 MAG: PIN domain protein [Ignavibacteria bacterium RIFOXYA2_FULL_35_10]OGV18719.1 MAG: PIN domain protein [Ignavibacteria bacterium RIFOXYC2_FULL_35_21]
MHKPRIYIDTSVIGGCFDAEFKLWSTLLFEDFISGKKIAVISETTLEELTDAPIDVKSQIKKIPEGYLEVIELSEEILLLANDYMKSGILGEKSREDALHIASATVFEVDVIVSWNFKHIVNLDKIRKFNAVNLLKGYRYIDIRTPMEVISYE